MPKWVPPLVGLFLLFVIYQQPDMAAEFARSFGGFLADLLGAVVQFLGSLFGGLENGDASGATTTTATMVDGGVDAGNGATSPLADHTHDHSHPSPSTSAP